MTSACGSDNYVCILGDFNAQTADLEDFTKKDTFLSEHFHFDQQTDDFFDQNCALEKYNLDLKRLSKDKKKNNSGFRLIDMCKNNNLTILNGRYGHDKQIGAMTFRDTSVIDYALASSDTFEILLDFEVVEVDRLFSDGHSLLALDLQTHSLNLPNPLEKNISKHTYIKPSEYECFVQNFDETKIANIVTELQTCDINTSKDAINNITSQIGELFQISASKVHDSRPANSTGTTKHDRPWFGHQCRNARKKYHLARRKYNLYNSSENKQQLISESRAYKKTMTKFINKHKKQQQNKLRQMQKSQPREYWKFLNSLKQKKQSEIPSTQQFYEYFKTVYSQDDADASENSDIFDHNFENPNEFLNCPFTPNEIDKCIKKLKNAKSSGHDSILNEYLKLTKDSMLPVYVALFNLILETGHVPEQWLTGKIRPIYKNKGDPSDPNNYRPITLLSCLGKLFTAVLNERLNTFLEDNDLLNENQAAFRKHYSTSDHIFTLYSLIELMKYEKKKLYCCFVDFSKAFDSVWRTGLWQKLLNTYVNGKFLKVLQNMYLDIKSCVSANGADSLFFFSNRGVRQGDNISPILFSLFLNDLENHLHADNIKGIPVECNTDNLYFFFKVYVLLYADDTIIIADNEEALQKSLHSFSKYCNEWKLHVNNDKTKVVVFGARKTNSMSFTIENTELEIVDSYKYLGTYFSQSRSFLKARKHILEQAKKAMHLLRMRIRNLYLPVDLQLKLFDHTVLPIMTYACEVWGYENCGMLESIHTQFLRSILRARKSTPTYMLYGELGRYPIEIEIKCRMINFWNRLLSGKQTKLAYLFYQKLRSTPSINSRWISKIQEILTESGRPDIWQHENTNPNLTMFIRQNLRDRFIQLWNSKLEQSSKGTNYKLFKDSINLEPYVLRLPGNSYTYFAKFRTGNHRFPCERGRWLNIELSERKCTLCNLHEVGDEFHYALVCPSFDKERKKFIDPQYFHRPNILKFKSLMNIETIPKLIKLSAFIKILVQTVS